jgi:hypothetical protein
VNELFWDPIEAPRLVLVEHETFTPGSIDSMVSKTHRYHAGPGENLHLSLLDKVLKLALHRVPDDKLKV